MNKFIKFIFNITCMGLVLITMSCSKSILPADTKTNILIDGRASDWNRDYFHTTSNNTLAHAYAFDEENLYVLIQATDEATVRKLMMLGVTIWIDGKGKKSKHQGLVYPQGIMDDLVLNRMGNSSNRNRQTDLLNLFEQEKLRIGLIGFFDNSKEMYHYALPELRVNIKAACARVSAREFTIELAVPLELIKKRNKKNIFGVGIETNTVNLQELVSARRPAGGGAMQRPGMNRRMSGQRGGGMERAKQQFQQLNETISVWSKVQIED